MKKIIYILSLSLLVSNCVFNEKKNVAQIENQEQNLAKTKEETIQNAVIYEANIRQYSIEGSFNAFTKDIPKLKELGVKVLWLMPIYPISKTKSKGSLGSYYAVSNYNKVNPEFGTLEDFRTLVKTAHENEMIVILDWVANHTGWDHHWITEQPDFYTKDTKGNITHTPNTDWTDVADLNYENPKLWEEMKKAMLYWIQNEKTDGFRCDVAGMVPTKFWDSTVAALRKVNPNVFMLAEAHEAELQEQSFDMGYGWDTHHLLNEIAQGKKKATDLVTHIKKQDGKYAPDDILMNFVTNHDENSWNGTVKERMGAASNTITALTYLLPGMPLIYSGQEYGMDKRLLFFEKDTIPKTKGKTWKLLSELGKLKNTSSALKAGKEKASYQFIESGNQNILILSRKEKDREVLFIGNLSDQIQTFKYPLEGLFQNYLEKKEVKISKNTLKKITPWEFTVLVK